MSSRPRVLFASTETFEAGDQLAACLRRHKVRVELFRPPAHGVFAKALRLVSSLVYQHVDQSLTDESDGPDLTGLTAALAAPGTIAVQATDQTLEPLVATLADRPQMVRRVCDAPEPQGMVDKRWQVRVAQEAGLSVPRVWLDPAAVDIFPVLIKPILGGGGAGIRPAADAQELAEQWRVAEAEGGPHFVQQRVHGRTMHVGGVAKQGVPVVIAAYEGDGPAEFGQISSGRLLPDPAAVSAARQFLGAAGYTGIFCFDFIRTESGEHYFLEVNPRIFGSWMTLQLGGVDLVTGYLYALGLSEPPPSPSPDYTTTWELKHPTDASTGQVLRAGVARVRTMRPFIGWRGSAVMLVDLVAHVRRTR